MDNILRVLENGIISLMEVFKLLLILIEMMLFVHDRVLIKKTEHEFKKQFRHQSKSVGI